MMLYITQKDFQFLDRILSSLSDSERKTLFKTTIQNFTEKEERFIIIRVVDENFTGSKEFEPDRHITREMIQEAYKKTRRKSSTKERE